MTSPPKKEGTNFDILKMVAQKDIYNLAFQSKILLPLTLKNPGNKHVMIRDRKTIKFFRPTSTRCVNLNRKEQLIILCRKKERKMGGKGANPSIHLNKQTNKIDWKVLTNFVLYSSLLSQQTTTTRYCLIPSFQRQFLLFSFIVRATAVVLLSKRFMRQKKFAFFTRSSGWRCKIFMFDPQKRTWRRNYFFSLPFLVNQINYTSGFVTYRQKDPTVKREKSQKKAQGKGEREDRFRKR